MSARDKGNRIQRMCIERFKSEGYLVSKTEQSYKYSTETDAFGLFDLVAINEEHITLIQVTTNTPHTHKKYIEFSKKYNIENVYYEQWVWYDRKGWKSFTYYNGDKYIEDLRK